jgi:hypothetical protein
VPFLSELREGGAVGAVEMWETRSVFQGLWAAVENRRTAPIARVMSVFHGCPQPGISTALRVQAVSGSAFADADQELAFGALHRKRGFGVGLQSGECAKVGEGHARPQQTLPASHFL